MKPAKRAKAQHYVPQIHLQHFCGQSPKNMVWTYSKRRGTALPSLTKETGHQNNYYSVLTEDGIYNDAVDKMLQDIESKASAPYLKLLADEIPKGQDRADFAVFVATCFSRSPALIRSYAENLARSMQLSLRLNARDRKGFDRLSDDMEKATGKKIGNRDQAFAFLNDPSRYTLGISEKRGLKAIGIADDLAPILYERSWCIVEAVGDRFITSDNPVYRWVPRETVHPIYGDGGFKNVRAEVSFPLSTTKMLLIGGDFGGDGHISVDPNDIWQLNRMRAANAEEFLFADRKDERVTALAKEFKDSRPRMVIGHEFAQDVEVRVTR